MPKEIPIRVLAVDPGTHRFGYAIFDGRNMLLESKQVSFPSIKVGKKKLPMQLNEKLDFIYKLMRLKINEYNVDVTVIEVPIRFRNVIIAISMFSAVLRLACMRTKRKVPTYEISPTSAKKAALGKDNKGRPKKGAIQKAISKKFGRRFWEDEADAVAIGLAFFEGKAL